MLHSLVLLLIQKQKANGIIRKVSPLVAIHKDGMIHHFYSRKTMPLEITVGAMQGYMIHLRPMPLVLGMLTHFLAPKEDKLLANEIHIQ